MACDALESMKTVRLHARLRALDHIQASFWRKILCFRANQDTGLFRIGDRAGDIACR